MFKFMQIQTKLVSMKYLWIINDINTTQQSSKHGLFLFLYNSHFQYFENMNIIFLL